MYEINVKVCVYKQKEWLHRLRSLNSQTLEKSRYEVVVVNDDPDETLDDVTDIFKEHMNIRVINNEKNLGLPTSLNKILKTSMSKYFVRVDCDDYVSSHFLYVLSTFLKSNSGPRVMNTDCNYQQCSVITSKSMIQQNYYQDTIQKKNLFCGIMYTYESLANLGFYNEDFKMREGHDLNTRFLDKYKMYHLRIIISLSFPRQQ